VIDNIVVGFEDAVREPVVAHVLPDIFDWIEFRAFRRQRDNGDIGGNRQSCRQMPSGLIDEKDGVGSWRHCLGDFREVSVVLRSIAARCGSSAMLRRAVTKKRADCRQAGPPRCLPSAGAVAKYRDRIDPTELVFIDETWTKTNRRCGAGHRAVNGSKPWYRTATGRPRPSRPLCAMIASPLRGSSRGQSTARPFLLYIETVWSRPCGTATSPSCTILARPKPTPCVEPSVPQAPGSSARRNTRPI
jgi:hypothetical protein